MSPKLGTLVAPPPSTVLRPLRAPHELTLHSVLTSAEIRLGSSLLWAVTITHPTRQNRERRLEASVVLAGFLREEPGDKAAADPDLSVQHQRRERDELRDLPPQAHFAVRYRADS